MMHSKWTWFFAAGLMLAAGCAKVPREAGFGDVQKTVLQRSGQRVHWDQGAEADREVAQAMRGLLDNELTAEAAVQVALLNNQNLQASYEDLGVAQAELVEAGLLRNPIFSAQVRFPKGEAIPYAIDVTQSFLDLLLLPRRKRVAGAAFDAAKLRVTDAVLELAAQARSTFYRAQGAEQLVEMHKNIAKATEASFDAAKRLHQAGNINELTLASEQALHERAMLDLASAQAEARQTREDLSELMGLWGNATGWKISPRLPELPAGEANAGTLEAAAIEQRLDLAAAREEIHAAGEALGFTKRTGLVPELSISGHAEREVEGDTTIGPGVELPLPIFSQGQPALAAARSRLRQQQKRYAALAVSVRSQTRRAYDRLLTARQRAEHYQHVLLPLRRSITQQTQLQYNAMHVGVNQLLGAKKEEIEAGREYVESLRDYWIAKAHLERVIGGRNPVGVAAAQPTPTSQTTTQPATRSTGHEHHH